MPAEMRQHDQRPTGSPPGTASPAGSPPGTAGPAGSPPGTADPTASARRAAHRGYHRPHPLDRIRAAPGGRLGLKIGAGVLGGALVVLGLILVPLPGPGWLIVVAGLAVLAVEYAWARHLLHFTRRQLRRWTDWLLRRSWPIRALVGTGGFVLVAAVVWASVRVSFGIDLAATAWAHLHT